VPTGDPDRQSPAAIQRGGILEMVDNQQRVACF
jgi:hypothetical protein